MKQFFRVKLNNAAYYFQLASGETGISRVYSYRPCCIAENGFILGVNNACDKFNIAAFEPLEKALVRCADLYAEEPRHDIIRRYSALFIEICSRFGIAKQTAFDECIIEADGIGETEIHSFTSAISEALLDELKTESNIQLISDFSQGINLYSASVYWNNYALRLLAEMLYFKLSVDDANARLFSMRIVDKNGLTHIVDRRVDVPCGDFNMLHFVLSNMLDNAIVPDSITANLYDIRLNHIESAAVLKSAEEKEEQQKKPSWYYAKHNKSLTDSVNKNKLYIFSELCDYIINNPDSCSFDDLCAIAEKSNTRRLRRGSWFMNRAYALKLFKLCKLFSQKGMRVLINGYCPFLLIFMIKTLCEAEISYSGMDERTRKLLEILDEHSPFPPLDMKPASETKYDLIISDSAAAELNSDNIIYIVKKSFFASDEKSNISDFAITQVFDFGEFGISGSYDQFAAIAADRNAKPDKTEIYSLDDDYSVIQKQEYITDDRLPCWVLYRNEKFDSTYSKMRFDLFDVRCSNQIKQRDYDVNGDVRVISASNIDVNGNVNINDNCRFVKSVNVNDYDISEFTERDDVFFAASKSSVLKVARKPKGCIPNPSTVLLIPKDNVTITRADVDYFFSPEFKAFYDVALNHQGFMLSTDRLSQYFLGKVVN